MGSWIRPEERRGSAAEEEARSERQAPQADVAGVPEAVNGDDIHVYPVNDLIEHLVEEGEQCVCGPHVEESPVYGCFIRVHHALDGRP